MRTQVRCSVILLAACTASEGAPANASAGGLPAGAVLSAPDTGGVSFDLVADTWSTADGGAIVYLPRQSRFLVFGPSGTLRGAIGRPGQGPGELGPVANAAGFRRDTLWAFDPASRRLQQWRPDGSLLGARTLGLQVPGWVDAGVVRSVLSDGTLLVQQPLNWGAIATGRVPPASRVARFEPTGPTLIGELDALDLSDLPLNATRGGAGVVGIQPLLAVPVLAVAPDGSSFAYVVPTDSGILVRARRPDGSVLFDRHLPTRGLELTRSRLDSARGGMDPPVAGLSPPVLRIPSHLPAFSRALVGPDQTVWLRTDFPLLRRPHEEWLVVRADTTRAVQLPPGVALLQADTSGYWALLDGDSAPRLQRYRFAP